VEDRLAIQELFARYNATFDTADAEGYAATFTEDGTMSGRHGRAEMAAFATQRAADRANGPHAIVEHVTTGLILAGDSGRADAFSYLQRFARKRDGGGFEILTVGFYVDVLRRVDGAWLFESREVLAEPPPPGSIPALRRPRPPSR
jgi:uncharacterized protein (TIGR02246 family)